LAAGPDFGVDQLPKGESAPPLNSSGYLHGRAIRASFTWDPPRITCPGNRGNSNHSGGLALHQLRHTTLTRLAEDGVDTALLKAKSRHRSLRSLERHVRPSDAAVACLTAAHDPEARRR
jgi:hypothetical protein